ncbi:methyltransferase domain-containing protein [Metasolibacillus meyeri]|uniref:Methyltransferase domain-containing protein n=1 Tax=Metasolibacillus meyeri TaxID=1071052 RepID=A0AAW9NSW5_9BACL|nr:methyltransferase domain-containing protein [Metasolibacillus meyeri]MEC1179412.1 methyltransferase domain-containing protein [Metasolibacillus meyeri]
MTLLNPTTFSNWLIPHSVEWYEQLGNLQQRYEYSWGSSLTGPNGESLFDEIVAQAIVGKKVLDVGCGHGDFTLKCSLLAKDIVGFDVTNRFIQTGLNNTRPNASFVMGNTKDGLPFPKDEFDCAYIRKGPTSAYLSLKNVVKKGGTVIGLHPGDTIGKELPILFPNLFEPTIGTPILNKIKENLASSDFSESTIETINSIEYIHSPEDILKLRCFGQHPSIYEALKEKNRDEITAIFEQHATTSGLPITYSRYIVKASI